MRKIFEAPHEVFLINETMAAIAKHGNAKSSHQFQPSVQIGNLGSGVVIFGADDLDSLRKAIDFAIDGPASADEALKQEADSGHDTATADRLQDACLLLKTIVESVPFEHKHGWLRSRACAFIGRHKKEAAE